MRELKVEKDWETGNFARDGEEKGIGRKVGRKCQVEKWWNDWEPSSGKREVW